MRSAAAAAERLRDIVPVDRAQRASVDAPAPQASTPTEVQGTRWRGASRSLRSLLNWAPPIGSATSDLPATEQRTLRARSRDAFRNHLLARAPLQRSRTAIVGTGLICSPAIDYAALGLTQDEAKVYNAQILSQWERWAEDPVECDLEATLDIYGQQSLALLSAMLSGDCMVLTPSERRPGGVSELKLQLIEADRVSNPHESPDTPNRIDGIEYRAGTPVGVHVRNTHPGDALFATTPTAWTYYPMFGAETGRRRVLHIWNDKERPGQVRGAPYLAPILEPLKQVERYSGAELTAAVVSAMLTFFIERDKDLGSGDIDAFDGTDVQGNISIGNGAVVDLAPGEKANLANPVRPNPNFDAFFVAVAKQIGAALEIPLDELLLQYNASYSAARAAMLQAWRFYLTRRWWLTQQFCVPVYGLFLDEEVASGRLSLPGYHDPIRRRAWARATWIGPARGSMDEWKEANAAEKRIAIGVSNEAMETAAMTGENWRDVYAQRKSEIDQRRRDGTLLGQTAPAAAADPLTRELQDEDARDDDENETETDIDRSAE